MPLLKSLQRGIRALFLSDADAKKAEQLGLFDAPVMVSGYVNSKGTFVGTHRSTRKKAIHSAEKSPAQHPLERAQVGPGSIVSWSKGDQPISGRVTEGPTTDGIITVTVTDSKNPSMKVGQHTIQHVDNITVVVSNEPPPAHAQSGLDFEADPPEPAPVSEPGAEVVQNHTVTPYDQFGAAYDATPAQRRADNAAALKLLNEKENNEFTDDDRRVLAKYSGAGGIGDSLNEYYTRQDVAEAMWGVVERLGIPGSSVLEPSCGTGMFMHTAPGGITVSGVELDPISARIAQVVHPTHDTMLAPFEVAANNGIVYDAVIGNPPFGPRGALIAQDKKSIPRAEQYFVDTALDKTREGGLVALVVPTGVLDASSARKLRRAWCCKGQFLGAIRMPNTAFKHSQTEVVTDVVFFRRRAPDAAQALQTLDDERLKALGVLDEEFIDGGYFAGRGAQNVMGTMEQGWRAKAGMGEDITVTGSMDGVAGAIAGFEPEEAKPVIMGDIEAALAGDDKALARARRAALKPVYDVAKVGDIRVIDGVRYVLQGHPPRWHRTEDVDGAPPEPEHVAAARGIGKQIAAFAAGEPGVGSGDIIAALEDHIERYGIPRKSAEFKAAAEHDPDLLRVMAAVRADGSFSDLLTGKTVAEEGPTLEAAAQRLSEAGDGFTADELVSAYPDIDKETALDHLYASNQFALQMAGTKPTFITMAQYLTGELWPKLDEVQAQLALSPEAGIKAKLELQAERLEETIAPKSLDDVELGMNYAWIPLDVLDEFCNHQRAEYLAGAPAAASWSKPYKITFEGAIYTVEGSGGPSADLLNKYLNRTGVQEKDWPLVHALNEEFAEWLLSSDQRQRVEDIYNRTYRGFIQPKFSSEPIMVPGLTTEMSVNDYHWAGLRWALARKKGICAADVGLGKTVRMLMLAKLIKVHGQAKKPLIVVPKSVLANWAAEVEQWFPGASVMIIGEKYTKGKDGKLKATAETAAERNQKYHDLSQNDYDFVLMSQPTWNELDIDPITKSKYSDDEFWTQRAEALGNAGDKRRRQIKENFEQAIAKRDFDKRTDVIYFNELGVDALIMDEAHCFPAGTLVDGKPIESLRVGHLVRSVDHKTGAVQYKEVTALMRRKVTQLVTVHLSNGESIACTPDHPFFTDKGYKQALLLDSSCRVMLDHGQNKHFPELPVLSSQVRAEWRTGVEAEHGKEGEVLLLQELRIEGNLCAPGIQSGIPIARSGSETPLARHGACASQVPPVLDGIHHNEAAALGVDRRETPGVLLFKELSWPLESEPTFGAGETASNSQKNAHGIRLSEYSIGNREESRYVKENWGDGWQWKAAFGTSPKTGECSRLGNRACDSIENGQSSGIQKLVCGRYCKSPNEDSSGGGRRKSSIWPLAGERSEEGRRFEWLRVDHIEVHQQTSDGRFGGLCSDGFVYDIEVADNHNFFAQGILVHNCFKNLFSAKNRFGEAPKFLGGSGESARAIDTQFKSRWVREQNSGDNVYFASASPTRNSPLEVYSMLQHIAPEAFLRMGIRNSEEFIDRFCEFTKDTFLDTNGAIGEALITSGFKNLDELREVMYRWMDRQTAKDVGLKIPKGEPVEHLIDMNADQQKAYAQLREAAKKGSKENADSHIFSIMDRMGKVALDMKLYQPNYKGEESPKYAEVAKVAAQHKEDGGQIIFCEAVDSHDRIKAGLVAAGFKPGEIAIINGQTAKTSLARQKVSDDFNSGKLKVVIGNKTMEEGMNLQKRTSDMHDLDIPWEPAALQQRHGRGVRQGNKLEAVRLHRYLSRGSFDGYRYQTMSAKKDWMDQLYGTATRTENLAAQMKPSRDEMLIMLSADPEAERAKYATNKGAALELHRAERRKAGGAGFERFRQLHRSYTALADKQSRTALKLKRSMDDAKTRLQADEYFEAKEALDAPDKILVDPSTGDSFKAGHGVEIAVEKGAPINYPEGAHKFVVASVDPAARTIALRPYGQYAGTITVRPHGIAGHSKHFEVDAEVEEADATANELGNIVGAAAKHATTGNANPEHVKAAVSEAVERVVKLASGASKDWHKTSAGRGRVWAMLADAIKQAAPAATDAALQKITDTAELSLALREHAIAGAELEDPVHLVGLPEAAILDNMPTILRHMHTVHAAYGGGNMGDNVPVIGAGGEADGKKSFEYRKNLGTTERFMLPIESDKKAAQQAWKKWQGKRSFDVAYRSSGRKSYSHSPSDRMAGVQIRYGNKYGDVVENPMGGSVTKLFGAGWEDPASKELEIETAAAAAAKTTFREKVTAWLPAASAPKYTRHLKWPGHAVRDLAAQAKQEGILDKLAANQMSETPYIFEGEKQWSGGTTVAAALRDAAARAGERELAEELAQHPQVALVQNQNYRSY